MKNNPQRFDMVETDGRRYKSWDNVSTWVEKYEQSILMNDVLIVIPYCIIQLIIIFIWLYYYG